MEFWGLDLWVESKGGEATSKWSGRLSGGGRDHICQVSVSTCDMDGGIWESCSSGSSTRNDTDTSGRPKKDKGKISIKKPFYWLGFIHSGIFSQLK